LLAALGTLVTHPARVLRLLAGAHGAAGRNPWAHLKLLAVMPKALAAARWLEALRVDHVHAHFATQTADCAAIAAGVAGIPFSFTAHAYDIYSTAPRVRNETLGWKLRRAARVFTVSDFGARFLRARLPPEDAGRVTTVHVGIPIDLFHPEAPPAAEPLALLCVARFQEKKGLDTLVDACALLRERGLEFRLRIFGDGPLHEAIAAQVRRLGLEDVVLLPGPAPQEEIARQMRASHLFVMPCRRDRTGDMDGIPTVFMEAMASGRPVVSCAVSGIPELVRHGETGVLVPPDDPQALAEAVLALAHDPEARRRLAAAGRTLVENQHEQRQNARRVVALIEESARARGGRAVDA
jgi:glycosyltransferase involved in cell wall biosynthesis